MPVWLYILVLGIVAPALAALAIAGATRPWRETNAHGSSILRSSAPLVAVFAAYLVGHLAFVGAPQLLPVDITHWLVHLAAVALACGIGLAWLGDLGAWAWLVRGAASLAVVWLIVRPLLAHRFAAHGAIVIAVGSLSLLAFVYATQQAVSRTTPRVGATLLLLLLAASAAATAASGTLLVAQLGGAATAGLGALWLVALRYPTKMKLAGSASMVALMAASVAILGYLYAAMPMRVLVLLLAMPFAFLLISAAASPFRWRARAPALALVATLLLASMAVVTAVAPAASDDASYGYE